MTGMQQPTIDAYENGFSGRTGWAGCPASPKLIDSTPMAREDKRPTLPTLPCITRNIGRKTKIALAWAERQCIPMKTIIGKSTMGKGKRRLVKAPVGANAARSGKKWSPGLKHEPARGQVYGKDGDSTTRGVWNGRCAVQGAATVHGSPAYALLQFARPPQLRAFRERLRRIR